MVGGSLRVLRLLPTTKTDRHDIAEILLKVALSTKNQSNESACVNQYMSCLMSVLYIFWDRRDRDRMVVGITTTCVISAYHH